MKAESKKTDTQLALQAMNRAASKVLNQAVEDNEAIPIWDGEKVIWKVPREEAQQLTSGDSLHGTAES